jgi:hypothetical protein
MAGEPMQEVVVNAVVTDAYDGLIRLLGDAQRFGFALRASTLSAEGDGSASVTLTLSVPARLDAELVAARLARHPVVQSLDAQVSPTRVGASHLYAVAA